MYVSSMFVLLFDFQSGSDNIKSKVNTKHEINTEL